MLPTDRVIILNKPKVSPHALDAETNAKRLELVPHIEEYIARCELFENKKIVVSFIHTGVSSLVCIIEADEKKYVLKIQLRENGPRGEGLFTRAWGSIGVPVFKIYKEGFINKHSYILMKYIPSGTFENWPQQDLIDKKIFYKMGVMLKKMHSVEASGYGRLAADEDKGEYKEFETWINEYGQTKNQVAYIQEHNLLPEETFGSYKHICDVLIKYVTEHPKIAYCHYDFVPGNILCTDPITIFDPVPTCNNPYLDIGRTIVKNLELGYTDLHCFKQFTDGYFRNSKDPINWQALHASIVFNAYTTIPYLHKTEQKHAIENIKQYLTSFKKLLD